MDQAIERFEPTNKEEAAIIRALQRAYKEGVHAQISGMHTQFGRTTAATGDLFHGYRVLVAADVTDCSCKAGACRMMCKHVAALADKAGALDLLIPNFYARAFAPTPIEPAVRVIELENCQHCNGLGTQRIWFGGRLNDYTEEACNYCKATGKVARELVAA